MNQAFGLERSIIVHHSIPLMNQQSSRNNKEFLNAINDTQKARNESAKLVLEIIACEFRYYTRFQLFWAFCFQQHSVLLQDKKRQNHSQNYQPHQLCTIRDRSIVSSFREDIYIQFRHIERVIQYPSSQISTSSSYQKVY